MTDDGIEIPGFQAMDGVEVFRELPLFRTLDFEETQRLFGIADPVTHESGTVVIEENALGEALYIVRKGHLDVLSSGAPIGRLGPGEVFGEMSLVDDVLTSVEVKAKDTVTLFRIPRADFDRLMERDRDLALKVYKAFCRTLADRLRRANAHVPDDERMSQGIT